MSLELVTRRSVLNGEDIKVVRTWNPQAGCNRCIFASNAQSYAPSLSPELGTRHFWMCVTMRSHKIRSPGLNERRCYARAPEQLSHPRCAGRRQY